MVSGDYLDIYDFSPAEIFCLSFLNSIQIVDILIGSLFLIAGDYTLRIYSRYTVDLQYNGRYMEQYPTENLNILKN